MQELATFSIETDTTVLLQFKNGRRRRVLASDLSRYLPRADVEKIKAAYRLRTEFIDTHMPKTMMVLVLILGAGVLGLTAVAGGRALAHFIHRESPITTTSPQPEGIARSLADPSADPTVMPSPSPAVARRSASPSPKISNENPSKSFRWPNRDSHKSGDTSSKKFSASPQPVPSFEALLTPLPTPGANAGEHGTVLDAATGPVSSILPTPAPSVSPSPSPSSTPKPTTGGLQAR